jgi:hypothetical protein
MRSVQLLRLFLSSTFRDMQRERDILARLILPRRRAVLATRGIALQEVDLRWGVTRAMSRGGGAVGICLREVAGCFPLVLGMLGRRSGQRLRRDALNDFDPAFAATVPLDAGMTEIEMRYAVHLTRRRPESRVLAMLRSDRLSTRMTVDRVEWEESAAFRAWVTATPAIRCIEYDDFDEFRSRVDDELGDLLARRVSDTAVPLAADAAAVPELRRTEELAALSRAAQGRRPTLVAGEPGIGTSWLVRHWVEQDPNGVYVDGRDVAANSLTELLRAGAKGGNQRPATADRNEETHRLVSDDQLTQALLEIFQSPTRRVAFDHYEDGFPSLARADFAWMPTRLPRSCSVIVVARAERLRQQATDLGWQSHTIRGVDAGRAGRFAEDYLKAFSKHLTPDQLGMLKLAPWGSNVANLILALDELRRHGVFETLDRRLAELAACDGGAGLVTELVAGLGSVMPQDWQDAVHDALLAIRLSVSGLQEEELQAAVGFASEHPRDDAVPLPSHLWSTIRMSFGSALASRGALVDIAGGPLSEWMTSHLLADAARIRRVAMGLSTAFDRSPPVRRWTEAPRLAEIHGGESGLAQLLAEPANVLAIMDIGETFAEGWFARLTPPSRHLVVSGWQAKLADLPVETIWRLGFLAARAGETETALHLLEYGSDHPPDAATMNVAGPADERRSLVALLKRDGPAIARLASQLALRESFGDTALDVSNGLNVLAACADGLVALDRHVEETLVRRVGFAIRRRHEPLLDGQLQIYSGQLLLMRRRWFAAARRFASAERAARRIGHARLLCQALERLAAVQLERNRFRAARRAATECRELAHDARLAEFEALGFERQIEVEVRRANWTAAYKLAEAFLLRCREGLSDVQRAKVALAMIEARE